MLPLYFMNAYALKHEVNKDFIDLLDAGRIHYTDIASIKVVGTLSKAVEIRTKDGRVCKAFETPHHSYVINAIDACMKQDTRSLPIFQSDFCSQLVRLFPDRVEVDSIVIGAKPETYAIEDVHYSPEKGLFGGSKPPFKLHLNGNQIFSHSVEREVRKRGKLKLSAQAA